MNDGVPQKENDRPVIIKFEKAIECDDCSAVTEIPKYMTLRESWCKECQSTKIRLYKPRRKTRNE